ncbi:MAG: phosphatase PAP2 family protein [Chitinophagaceae bacterium]
MNLPKKRPDNTTLLVSVSFLIPVVMIWLVFIYKSSTLDDRVFSVTDPLLSSPLTRCMKMVSFLGSYIFLVPANILLIVWLLVLKRKQLAWHVTVVALSSLGIMSLLKNLFRRPRPDHPLVEGVTNFSFPSGHAMMGVAFYGLLIWLAAEYIKERKTKILLIVLLSLLLLVIGFSRIYLRMHYVTDVLAGYGIGVIWLYTCLHFLARYEKRMK